MWLPGLRPPPRASGILSNNSVIIVDGNNILVNAISKIYDQTTDTPTIYITLSGLVNNDSYFVNLLGSQLFSSINVGYNNIITSYNISGSLAYNYSVFRATRGGYGAGGVPRLQSLTLRLWTSCFGKVIQLDGLAWH